MGSYTINSLIISYGFRKGKAESSIIDTNSKELKKSYHIYYKHRLPILANPRDYGPVFLEIGNTLAITLKRNVNLTITFEESNNEKINRWGEKNITKEVNLCMNGLIILRQMLQ
jgi:hypothetical protein